MKNAILIAIISIFLVGTINAQTPVAYYKFDGNTLDSSGNGYHATNYGATPTTDRNGNANSAYEFNGISNYIDTETSFDYVERTVAVWVMVYDLSSRRTAIDMDDINLAHGSIGISFKDQMLGCNAGGNWTPDILTNPSTYVWYHVAIVRDSVFTYYYVNGELMDEGIATSNGSLTYTNPEMVVGVNRTKSQFFFKGVIDDLIIYDEALNASQIDSIYDPTQSVIEENLATATINVYPNPASHAVTVDLSDLDNVDAEVSIYNLLGVEVKNVQTKDLQTQIDIADLTPGTYMVRVVNDEKSFVERICVY